MSTGSRIDVGFMGLNRTSGNMSAGISFSTEILPVVLCFSLFHNNTQGKAINNSGIGLKMEPNYRYDLCQ